MDRELQGSVAEAKAAFVARVAAWERLAEAGAGVGRPLMTATLKTTFSDA